MIKKRKIEFDQLYWTFDYFNRLILHFYLPKKGKKKQNKIKNNNQKATQKIVFYTIIFGRVGVKLSYI